MSGDLVAAGSLAHSLSLNTCRLCQSFSTPSTLLIHVPVNQLPYPAQLAEREIPVKRNKEQETEGRRGLEPRAGWFRGKDNYDTTSLALRVDCDRGPSDFKLPAALSPSNPSLRTRPILGDVGRRRGF
ncbi:hypothetical protein LZ30DRAFT_773812 [Colletotrichum cereale]|nr:hypothetical protein LZ30DRAFT_773812 [Colletotrichum cereale]